MQTGIVDTAQYPVTGAEQAQKVLATAYLQPPDDEIGACGLAPLLRV